MTPVLLAPEGLLVQISALGAVSGSLLFFYPKGTSPCSLPKFFVRLAHPCRFPGSLPKTCISLSLWAFIPSWREGAPSISDVRLPGDEHWHGQLPGSPNSDAYWPSLRSFLVYLGQCQEPGCQLASLIGKLDSLSLSSLGMSLQASFWEIFLGLLVSWGSFWSGITQSPSVPGSWSLSPSGSARRGSTLEFPMPGIPWTVLFTDASTLGIGLPWLIY